MADETASKVVTGTLATTTPEEAQLTTRVNEVWVHNHDSTNIIWVRPFPHTNGAQTGYVAPVANADECIPVFPRTARQIWKSARASLISVGVLGNAGVYTVEGRTWTS